MSEIEPKDVLEVGAKTLFGPVQDLFLKLTGPAAEEYGLMWGDSVKRRRTKRLVKGLAKTKTILAETGFDPQAVPDKLLLPIFEGMSVEDDENLHNMWAALLANASSPDHTGSVRPGFIATLRQMSPDEAVMLNYLFFQRTGPGAGPFNAPFSYPDLMVAYADLGFSIGQPGQPAIDTLAFETCFHNLESEKLIEVTQGNLDPSLITPRALTFRGLAFSLACRPPKQKA